MTKGRLRTVMVVEDDARASAGVLAALSHLGFEIISVGNGRMALDQLTAGTTPDVILLDLVMPEMDGWEFLDRVKGTTGAAVPVIVTTSTGMSPEWVTSRGSAGYLQKPYTLDDLLAELRRVLGPI